MTYSRPPAGPYGGPPPGWYPPPPGPDAAPPQPADPLVSSGYLGWWRRGLRAVRVASAPLLAIQLVAGAVSLPLVGALAIAEPERPHRSWSTTSSHPDPEEL